MFDVLEVKFATKCFRCHEPIDRGEYAMRGFALVATNTSSQIYYHPMCAVDVAADRVHYTLRGTRQDFPNRAFVEAFAQSRLDAKRALAEARAKAKRKGVPVEAPSVEPARDPKGRPRVRVFCSGSLLSSRDMLNLFLMAAPEYTLTSALREYVFLEFVKITRSPMDDDPSQPVIGGVFATISTVKIMQGQKDKLAMWKTLGIPTPLLWVVDLMGDKELVDKRVLELRAALDAAGYVGDEAPVVVTSALNEAAMQSLALAMDEGLGLASVQGEAVDAGKKAADQLRSLIEANDTGAYVATLNTAKRCVRGAHAKVKTQLAEDALVAAKHGAARAAAIEFLLAMYEAGPTTFPPGAREVTIEKLPSIVQELLANPGSVRGYPPELRTAMWLMEQLQFQGRWALLLPAYCAPKITDTRRKALEAWLQQCSDRATQIALKERAEMLSEKEPERKEAALALVVTMEVACKRFERASAAQAKSAKVDTPKTRRAETPKATVN